MLAILLAFSPGIAFALFELFVTDLPVKSRAKFFGWVSLGAGIACVAWLAVIYIREAIERKQRRVDQP
ncbi:MAG TPA: hypothetical protein VJO34_09995 [Methylomirabilota bacterium]|nr:hypothetical protein [Methylomirabilota bacterium]